MKQSEIEEIKTRFDAIWFIGTAGGYDRDYIWGWILENFGTLLASERRKAFQQGAGDFAVWLSVRDGYTDKTVMYEIQDYLKESEAENEWRSNGRMHISFGIYYFDRWFIHASYFRRLDRMSQ